MAPLRLCLGLEIWHEVNRKQKDVQLMMVEVESGPGWRQECWRLAKCRILSIKVAVCV